MARKTTEKRTLTCIRTGKEFIYLGHGRPPKYHPDVAPIVRAEQRAKAAKNRKKAA